MPPNYVINLRRWDDIMQSESIMAIFIQRYLYCWTWIRCYLSTFISDSKLCHWCRIWNDRGKVRTQHKGTLYLPVTCDYFMLDWKPLIPCGKFSFQRNRTLASVFIMENCTKWPQLLGCYHEYCKNTSYGMDIVTHNLECVGQMKNNCPQ